MAAFRNSKFWISVNQRDQMLKEEEVALIYPIVALNAATAVFN